MGHNSPYGGMRPSVTVYVAALGGTMRCTNLTRKNFKFQSSPGDFIVHPGRTPEIPIGTTTTGER